MSKNYTAEELSEKHDKFLDLIKESFSGDRQEKLLDLYSEEKFGERLIMSPAAVAKQFHNCYVGGYVDHIFNVVKASKIVQKAYEVMGGKITWTDEERIFAAIHHDLGKLGTYEGEPYYVECDQDWWIKKGYLYTVNEKIQKMHPPERGLFILQQAGITYTENEMLAIKLADGLYDSKNEFYLMNSIESNQLKCKLPHIIHWADNMACQTENDNR
jgi:hypothetical protein